MRRHKLFYQSSYNRGLDVVLKWWPKILERFPDATLDVCYGWDFFDKMVPQNELAALEWKAKVEEGLKQPGIAHHGRVGQKKLKEIRKNCGILAYPTYFPEIYMISGVEAQADGLVPVTMKFAALPETIKGGVLVEGDIRLRMVQEEWVEKLFEVMNSQKIWKELSEKGKKFAKTQSWDKAAKKWTKVFTKKSEDILVSIYTPTVRDGWWNVMASNIASQSYKNIEWIIVDDKPEDRSKIAKKYAKEYGLNIRYMKGKKRNVKRTYSLCNANNTAIKAAKGQLFVFLQDFVLLSETGIEQLVIEHRRHPEDFIAPVDMYFKPKYKPNIKNEEDWFDGMYDVVGEFMRANIRVQNSGIRRSHKISDFEHNFGAVATETLRKLGGYWEFFDEALGWDDTEIIYRAFEKGYKLWVDDRNIAACVDHWGTLGKNEGGKSVNRTRRLNDPRYIWMVRMIREGKLPVIRKQSIDDKIDLQYTIPQNVKDEDCVDWIKENLQKIINKWDGVL